MFSGDQDPFGIFISDYRTNRILYLLRWIKKKHNPFAVALSCSILMHIALLSGYMIGVRSVNSDNDSRKNIQALSKAFQNVQARFPLQSGILSPENLGTAKGILDQFPNLKFQGDKISAQDRVYLFQSAIDDFMREKTGSNTRDLTKHMLTKETFKLDSGGKAYLSRSASSGEIKVNVLSKDTLTRLEKSKKAIPMRKDFQYLQNKFPQIEGEQVKVNLPKGMKIVPAGYFFRECPYEELAANGADLFYIIKGFPYIADIDPPVAKIKEPKTSTEKAAKKYPWKKQEGDYHVFMADLSSDLFSKLTAEKAKNVRMPASDSDFANSAEILDELMLYTDEIQFDRYEQEYLAKYDLNSSALAKLTEKFINNNLSNVFIPLSDISCAFDYIEEIYYNEPLDKQIYSFWQANPETKVGIQFLFYMASHYDFERRAIQYLFKAYKDAKDYLNERFTRSELHEKKTKCIVICRVYEDLMQKLDKRGYRSLVDVLARYVEEEENIYRKILNMGGKYRNVSLFALGSLYWEGKQYDMAFDYWDQIDKEYHANPALEEIRRTLAWTDDVDKLIENINSHLSYYSNRGSKALLVRLLKFGHWNKRAHSK